MEVLAFLHRKLEGLPFADLTRQIQEAKTARYASDGLERRLVHGRLVLLNRCMTPCRARHQGVPGTGIAFA